MRVCDLFFVYTMFSDQENIPFKITDNQGSRYFEDTFKLDSNFGGHY